MTPNSLVPRLFTVLAFCPAMVASPLEWKQGQGYRRAGIEVMPGLPRLTLLPPTETNLRFTNQLSEALLAKNHILELGSGVAIGDVNGDGWPDLYFCAIEGSNRLFKNLGGWRFEDITRAGGVGCPGQFSTGCAFADVDGDADLDLLVNGLGAGTRLFINNGRGVFNETDAGLRRADGSTSMALADVSGDGLLDLYVANYHTRTLLDQPETKVAMRNVGGRLEIKPEGVFLPIHLKNGRISLFERAQADQLYLNEGRGRFRSVDWTGGAFRDAHGEPLREPFRDWGLSVMFRDINRDGAPDIYVCNDFFHSRDHLWINDGQGNFRLSAGGTHLLSHSSMSSMAVDFADINRDGLDDFIVFDMLSRDHRLRHRQRGTLVHLNTQEPRSAPQFRPEYPQNSLYLARNGASYAEIAQLAGLDASEWTWSACFLDVDLDGYEDLLVGTGNLRNPNDADANKRVGHRLEMIETPNLLFRNQGDLTFREVGREWGFNLTGITHGMALGDLDNDGDLDVILNNMRAPAAVYRNDGGASRVAVRLKGRPPNTRGIGARITVRNGAVPLQSQEVIAGGRYLSSDDGIRSFATGSSSNNISILVRWPSGKESRVEDVRPNSIYEIDESAAVPADQPASQNPTPLFQNVSHWLKEPHHDAAFDDWSIQPLLPESLGHRGPGVSWFDVDQDGWDDLIAGNGRGGIQMIFLNTRTGFRSMKREGALSRDQTTLLGWRDAVGVRLLSGFTSYEDGATNLVSITDDDLTHGRDDLNIHDSDEAVGPLALGFIDGKPALFVGGNLRHGKFPEAVSSRLYHRNSNQWLLSQTFTNIGVVNGATWADLDGDGSCELIVACDWGPLRVFTRGSNKLVEVTARFGLDRFIGRWNGVATGDFDGDGLPEIVASNWGRNTRYERHRSRPIRLYYGDWNGDGRTDLIEAYFDPVFGAYIPFATLDRLREAVPALVERYATFKSFAEATMDQILGDHLKTTRLLEASWFESSVFRMENGRFVPRPLPIETQFAPAFGIAVGDADGDGHEDLFLAQNFLPVDPDIVRMDAGQGIWLRGDGKGNFNPLSALESGIALHGDQRGCAISDFDNDGRIDLAVGINRGPFALFWNVGGRPGLRVRLRGPAENPEGLGASIRVRYSHGWGPARTVQAGSGYWSQSGTVQVFARAAQPLEARVVWPGGRLTTMAIPPDASDVAIPFQE